MIHNNYRHIGFDIDGVLCSTRIRNATLRSGDDWDAFPELVLKESPIEAGWRLLRSFAQEARISFVTMRHIKIKEETREWLNKHGAPQGELYMRTVSIANEDLRALGRAKAKIIKTASIPFDLFIEDCREVFEAIQAENISVCLFQPQKGF